MFKFCRYLCSNATKIYFFKFFHRNISLLTQYFVFETIQQSFSTTSHPLLGNIGLFHFVRLIRNTHRRRDSTVELSRVVSALWTHPSAVVTQFTISCAVELTSDDIMTSLLKKLSISINIHVVNLLWSLFDQFPNRWPNPSVVVVSYCVHTADADAGGVYWA